MSTTAYHFWSPTCGPCKTIRPALEDLREEFSNVEWVSVNIQDDPQNLARKYYVKFIPTVVLVTNNQTADRHSGADVMGYYRMFKKITQPE
jgi:thioredoxin-like negative regulator of GroEL